VAAWDESEIGGDEEGADGEEEDELTLHHYCR